MAAARSRMVARCRRRSSPSAKGNAVGYISFMTVKSKCGYIVSFVGLSLFCVCSLYRSFANALLFSEMTA